MEDITRLVSESLARHGFDRPLDYRRLQWSRWFRCESHHSLLHVPSKPGVFAIAEEIMDFEASSPETEIRKPETPRRMLAVTQFFEEDDMAFVLDRMLATQTSMRPRLASGRYFVRFVVIDDQTQRRSICSALNQWMASSAEKASGIGSHFASSLELTPQTEYVPAANGTQPSLFDKAGNDEGSGLSIPATAGPIAREHHSDQVSIKLTTPLAAAPQLDSGAATNIHCPSPFPSGF